MYSEILEILKCPICGKPLSLDAESRDGEEVIEGMLDCENGHSFSIHRGVINFGSTEQEFANNWSETYKEQDYEEVDKAIADGTPDNLKKIHDDTKSYIVSFIDDMKPKYVLDIATGRGMLLSDMAKRLNSGVHIICTDLSFEVLVYDRLKVNRINPGMKVDFIACDATKLPFKDNSIDCAVSLFGIANMLNATEDGIRDAARVLKQGCYLLNSFIVIEEKSNGYKMANKFLEDNNMAGCEKYFNKRILDTIHSAEFNRVDMVTIGESIGEKNEFDLIPFEGEWFAEIIFKCAK